MESTSTHRSRCGIDRGLLTLCALDKLGANAHVHLTDPLRAVTALALLLAHTTFNRTSRHIHSPHRPHVMSMRRCWRRRWNKAVLQHKCWRRRWNKAVLQNKCCGGGGLDTFSPGANCKNGGGPGAGADGPSPSTGGSIVSDDGGVATFSPSTNDGGTGAGSGGPAMFSPSTSGGGMTAAGGNLTVFSLTTRAASPSDNRLQLSLFS